MHAVTEPKGNEGKPSPGPVNPTTDTEQKPKALVIDDDPVMVGLLERYLSRSGYTTFTTMEPHQGLALAAYHQPAVILMDVMMPRLSGLAALRLIRQTDATSKIPVVIITANDQAETRKESVSAGANAFLVKPFGLGQFLAEINRVVKKAA